MMNTYTFPIGCPQIIFHKRTPLFVPELGTTQDKLTISGQVNFSSHLQADGNIEMIVVVFYPHTINMFLNTPASAFYNKEISGYDIEDKHLNELAMQVLECENNSLCVNLIEKWLLSRLSTRPYDTTYRVNRMNAAIEKLCTAPHTLVTELSSNCCLCKKQFERVLFACRDESQRIFSYCPLSKGIKDNAESAGQDQSSRFGIHKRLCRPITPHTRI